MLEQATNRETFIPSMTLLNSSGDVTLTWDEKDEAKILALVEKKMKSGYSFFVLKPRRFRIPGSRKERVKNVDAVRAAGHVVVPDELVQEVFTKHLGDADVEQVVNAGEASIVNTGSERSAGFDTIRRAQSAAEVVKHQTMAVRPIVGG